MQKKADDINKTLSQAKWIIGLGFIIVLLTPYLLTRQTWFQGLSFADTGQIGDTIGGITAPFVNLLGAILVFLALKAQIQANKLVQDQIDRDSKAKDIEAETANLNLLYTHLNEGINNFKFKTLPVYQIGIYNPDESKEDLDTQTEEIGGAAFFKLFDQILCHYEYPENTLALERSALELYSLLSIVNNLLDRLQNTESKSGESLKTLIKYQFEYKITARIRYLDVQALQKQYCSSCGKEHGIPRELLSIILEIRSKLGSTPSSTFSDTVCPTNLLSQS